MANQPQCNFCAPAGSGNCKDCQGTQSSGSAKCVKCYGSGKCRHCDGTGLELSTIEKIKDVLLWLWVMSWFAFIGAFVWVGIWEYRIAQSAGGRVTNSCLVLMSTTIFLWVLFFVVDHKARSGAYGEKSWKDLVRLSTLAGTILAIYTLLGVLFFVYIAPRLP
jgi:hypothetical protein